MHVDNGFLNGTPLAEGGEAIIYQSPNTGRVIKIYKPCVDKKDKLSRITNLMKKKLPANIIVPLDIVYDPSGKFIGYEMKAVSGDDLKRLGNKKFVKANNITVKDIVFMLTELRNTVDKLHAQNIFVSDFNDSNILFDKDFNLYFIDVDSWTIDGQKCQVCMESFQDPQLTGNNFSADTDNYAFAIIAFKSLTRLHPFGGTTDPDMDLLERMKKKLSVLGHPEIKVPRTVERWEFMSPDLLNDMKSIYEQGNRVLLGKSLDDFRNNLKFCDNHGGHYYSKYNDCPVCNANAVVKTRPDKIAGTSMPFVILFNESDVKINIDKYTYISNGNKVVSRKTNFAIDYIPGYRCYFGDRIAYKSSSDLVEVAAFGKVFGFKKAINTGVAVSDNTLFMIDSGLNLIKLTITEKGNEMRPITKATVNSIFEVSGDKYFVHSIINDIEIINISGYSYVNTKPRVVKDYGLHHDPITGRWLFVTEDNNGGFHTRVFEDNKVLYEEDKIRYSCPLNNLCFYNSTIFIPRDGAIRGFSYKNNAFKDFECSIVSEDSKLIREEKKFVVVNEKEVYQVG